MFGTELKICGLKRLEDIIAVNRHGADYAGFVFFEKSKRYVDPYKANELISLLRADIKPVGVFLDEPIDNVVRIARISGVELVQLHGHESEEYVEYVKRTLDRPVIKAYKASEEGALEKAAQSSADYVMIDSGAGSGKKFDWSILKDFKRDYFLAGGLDPESVGEAIRMLEPFAVDVSSGVETNGIKDEKKIAEFIKAVRYGR
ncbi:phosphoribosylanthranilate isomerase [Butyrivibrio sp. AE2032]|uniref:phosphoribosylanthranilate isomerase n=1 Tax=Butyrivibrio sp. AE2032 TaxID=1458463 RepID=UPI00054DA95C|nr:phosphoribosylanthranilate isomerase [Butyrivibrio sp. AE2032]